MSHTLNVTAGDTVPYPINLGVDMTDHVVTLRVGTPTTTIIPVDFTDRLTGMGQYTLPSDLPIGVFEAAIAITFPDLSHKCTEPFTIRVREEV